ncbi:MAG: diguanylate cyclase [Magnetococcales bacterium]|nr:diguanylate cyclase [Magnetococcales bacterium]
MTEITREATMQATEAREMQNLILVAEDEPAMREALHQFLIRQGYAVVLACNGQEAIDMCASVMPDLILLDVRMPKIDGLTACRTLRKDTIGPRIPIIMLTALFDAGSVDRAFEAGADDYITKPVHWAILRQRIRVLMERRGAEARIHHQATFDALTDLPNRTLFLDRLEHAIQLSTRNQSRLALLFIDLDGFKQINDTYGHAAGDALLRQLGQRLKDLIRHSDTLARLGGDEFTAIIAPIGTPHDTEVVADKILLTVSEPYDLDGQQATISASIGITLFPDDADTTADLLQNADQAMYQAKKLGKNRHHFYRPESTP